jgi:hypothetical protein
MENENILLQKRVESFEPIFVIKFEDGSSVTLTEQELLRAQNDHKISDFNMRVMGNVFLNIPF